MSIKSINYFILWVLLFIYLDPVSSKETKLDLLPDTIDAATLSSIGCVSCSQNYLLNLLPEANQTMSPTEIKALLQLKIRSHVSCEKLSKLNCKIPQISVMGRNLLGDGSHRRLITSMIFDVPSHGTCEFDSFDCNVVLIESLSTGVFADSFELSRLVGKRVYRDAVIFGDKNLELPSLLSNRASVEIHLNENISTLWSKSHQLSCELPLHARYPPLDASGYSKVEIGPPNVAMFCKPKMSEESCFSYIHIWDLSYEEEVTWDVPCGNQSFSALVSRITFASALVSAFAIVYVSIDHACSSREHAKKE